LKYYSSAIFFWPVISYCTARLLNTVSKVSAVSCALGINIGLNGHRSASTRGCNTYLATLVGQVRVVNVNFDFDFTVALGLLTQEPKFELHCCIDIDALVGLFPSVCR